MNNLRDFMIITWLTVLSICLLFKDKAITKLEYRLDDSDFAWAKVVRRVHNDIYQLQNPPKPKPVKPLAPRIDLLEKKMDAVVDAIVQDQLEKALEQEMRRQTVPPATENPFRPIPQCGSPDLSHSDSCIDYGPGRTKL